MNPRDFALKPLPKDDRDFSHNSVFGTIAADDLPNQDFLVSVPLEIKNQDIDYFSDFCSSYAASEVAEDEDQVIFVPEWTFAQAKGILAAEEGVQVFSEFGLDLRQICDAAAQKGFLPRLNDPFHCDTTQRPARQFIVNPANWPVSLESIAIRYKKPSYFTVDGPHDTFDNMRSAMWQNIQYRRSILTGCVWRASWSHLSDGVIPKTYESNGTPHAFKILGQKTINGEVHLVAQLSDGSSFGDNGYFYFPREVVNKEFGKYGIFMFSNMPKEQAVWYMTQGVSVFDPWIKKAARFISKYIGL